MNIYANKVIDFSFDESLLQPSDVELSEQLVNEFNSVRKRYLALQEFLRRRYFEGLDNDK